MTNIHLDLGECKKLQFNITPCLPPQKSIIPRGQYPHNDTILKGYNCILSIEV